MSNHYHPPLWESWQLCRFGSLIIVVDERAHVVAVATVSDDKLVIVSDQEERRAEQKEANRTARRARHRAERLAA